MSKYTISFVAILAAFFFAYAAITDINASSNQKNDQYSNYLTTATHDAAKQMRTSVENGIAMPNEEDRENVRDTFFESLSKDFGYTSQEDLQRLHIYVPALLLVDSNGYYICYNQADNGQIQFALTSLNTWTETVTDGDYSYDIQYYLGHRITVMMSENTDDGLVYTKYEGDYEEVAKKIYNALKTKGLDESHIKSAMNSLYNIGIRPHIEEVPEIGAAEKSEIEEWNPSGNAANPSVSDVNTAIDNHFEFHRNEIIIPTVEEKVNYYINNNNEAAASYQDIVQSYTFTMPDTTDNEWSRMLKNPTVIGFLQGIRQSDGESFLNIYAMSSGEISKAKAATFTDSDSGKRTYTSSSKGTDGTESGYVPGDGSAAAAGGEDMSRPSKSDKSDGTADGTYVHHHWGDPLLGTGCYGTPVYFQLTSASYDITVHNHVDASGSKTGTTNEDGTITEVTQVVASKGSGGCYTVPVYHQHTTDCYKKVFHHHTGSPTTGGGCYTTAWYHTHTSSCYSKSTTTVYQPTKNIYHSHTDPVYYYAKSGDTSDDEYTEEEALNDSSADYYIIRVDATGDTCYTKVTYARSKFRTVDGTKTLIVEKTTDPSTNSNLVRDSFTVQRAGRYTITTGSTTGKVRTLAVGDVISVNYANNETTVSITYASNSNVENLTILNGRLKVTAYAEISSESWSDNVGYEQGFMVGGTYTRKTTSGIPSGLNNAYYLYKGTLAASGEVEYRTETAGDGKALVANGFYYYSMTKTCGKTENTIEEVVNDGDPIVTTKPGQLICGKTTKTVEFYARGCGKVDISDEDSGEMKMYRAGEMTAEELLKLSVERTDVVCGYTDAKIASNVVGYKLSCGKEEGQTIYTVKPEEQAKVGTIDHYSLSCGYDDGDPISKTRYEWEQQQKAAAGY